MNIVVAQSGGPTAVINASLLGVFREAMASGEVETVFGALHGVEGLLNDDLVSLNDQLETPEDMALLRQTPSSVLGSCRYKMPAPEEDTAPYEKINRTLEAHGIGGVFLIGGNDSMDTVAKLARYFASVDSPVRVMGVPKTVDNDLVGTDHTPGFGSAAKYIATTVAETIRDCTVYDLDSVTILEIMGRDTGWLTAAAALPHLCGEKAPHLVYLPETPFSVDNFVEDVKALLKEERTVIVAVSEGVEVASLADYQSGAVDNFGHKYLAGVGKCLADIVKEKIGCKVRSIELNTPQRSAAHCVSLTDREEAEQAGEAAVKAALEGKTGMMTVFHRVGPNPYQMSVSVTSVQTVANAVKYVPGKWINKRGNNVSYDLLAYIRPLIMGETKLITKNGIPAYFKLKK